MQFPFENRCHRCDNDVFAGGERLRVGLARAIYGRPTLCLLDDPFASLDPATSSLVWHAAIRGEPLRWSGHAEVNTTRIMY